MADFVSMARGILHRQKKEINAASLEAMVEELEKCRHGRKLQVLLILEKNARLTSGDLMEKMNIVSPNLGDYTKRLEKNLLIEIYDGTRFMDPALVNYKYRYHSITDIGRELIADLGK